MIRNREPSPEDRLPCTVTSGHDSYALENPSEGYKLAHGIGMLNNITTVSSNGTWITILVPSTPHPFLDWRAKTIGVTTQCENIASQCINTTQSMSNSEFRCPKSLGFPSDFSGSIGIYQGGSAWNWTLFPNTLPANTTSIEYNLPNPYNFVLQAVGTEKPQDALANDTDMMMGGFYVSNTILRCSTTIYDVVYSSINDTIIIEDHRPSNRNTSQSINGPTVFSLLPAASEQANLQSFVQSGFSYALFSSTSVKQMSQSFADSYSRVTLAFGSTALDPIETLAEQKRTVSLVTCVPKAPLWTLVSLAGLYLFLTIVLTLIAFRNTSIPVADIQSQLSIHGLTATSFESTRAPDKIIDSITIEDRFEELRGELEKKETRRVGFSNETGVGWEYVVVKS